MRFEIYKDRKNQYRWRAIADNNKRIATSGESYINYADCMAAIELLQAWAHEAEVVEVGKKREVVGRKGKER